MRNHPRRKTGIDPDVGRSRNPSPRLLRRLAAFSGWSGHRPVASGVPGNLPPPWNGGPARRWRRSDPRHCRRRGPSRALGAIRQAVSLCGEALVPGGRRGCRQSLPPCHSPGMRNHYGWTWSMRGVPDQGDRHRTREAWHFDFVTKASKSNSDFVTFLQFCNLDSVTFPVRRASIRNPERGYDAACAGAAVSSPLLRRRNRRSRWASKPAANAGTTFV